MVSFYVILNKCKTSFSSIPNSRVSFVKMQVSQVVHSLSRTSRFYANSHDLYYMIVSQIMDEMQ